MNQISHKKEADIYSLGVTMYETIKWGKCYEGEDFQFAWDIADFVMSGKRVTKPKGMKKKEYEVIEGCWKQEASERTSIEEVIKRLEKIKKTYESKEEKDVEIEEEKRSEEGEEKERVEEEKKEEVGVEIE